MPPPMAAASVAWNQRRWLAWIIASAAAIPVLALVVMIAAMGGLQASSSGGSVPSPFAVDSIPPEMLRLYVAAGAEVGGAWEYLAAIGKVETDHGRSTAPGVHSGVNAFGCCAGPMQFSVIASANTWGAYGVDGNHDGRKSPYDPEDAIPAAAAYLKASGAPGDWDGAIFAYNHAGWYVAEVKRWAERYRGPLVGGLPGLPATGGGVPQVLVGGRRWLERVPGSSAVCDYRIVPDVVQLLERYKMAAGDCFAMTGHTIKGEHPLGLGIDLVPAQGGSWALVGQLAHDLGWRSSCGVSGCAGQLPAPFRFVGWNGYQGHGDPAHAGGNAHLHLSWEHSGASPGSPAERVLTMLRPRP